MIIFTIWLWRSFNKFGGITCYLGANYLQLEHNNNEIGKGLAYQ